MEVWRENPQSRGQGAEWKDSGGSPGGMFQVCGHGHPSSQLKGGPQGSASLQDLWDDPRTCSEDWPRGSPGPGRRPGGQEQLRGRAVGAWGLPTAASSPGLGLTVRQGTWKDRRVNSASLGRALIYTILLKSVSWIARQGLMMVLIFDQLENEYET